MRNIRKRYLTLLTWICLVFAWQVIAVSGLVSSALLPSPVNVVKTFIQLCLHGYNGIPLQVHFCMTLFRLFIAVILAILIATPLGLASGRINWIYDIVDSVIQFIRPLPPLSYYMILILWIGIGEESKITLLFLAAFAPIYIACVSSVNKVDQEYVNSARSLGASEWQVFWHVILPATLPDIFAGIRTATGVAYTTVVAAEMVAATYGIGWMIINASKYLKSNVMFVGIIILGITGVVLDKGLKAVEKRLVFWEGKR